MDDSNSTPVMTSDEADLVEDEEHDSRERVLLKYFLQEWVVVKSILDSILSNGGVSRPPDVQKIRSIMDKYQEQGQLLEPYLDSIVSPLMLLIREKATQPALSTHQLLQTTKPLAIIVYSLVTVCGYKSVVRFFPHHVSDLEPAVGLLEKCHHVTTATSLRQESTGEMEMKCVLLLWLYVLVLIPFDIASVDTSTADRTGGGCGEDDGVEPSPPLVLKIVGFSKDYLSDAGPMRRISGLLLSRLLTRPDMLKAFTSFFEWTHQVLLPVADNVVNHFTLLGIVEALASIFKVGSQNILLNSFATIWDDISNLVKSTTALRSSLLRKFIMKLSQRIALVCLPHRSPSWRYMVRKSSLGEATSHTFVNGDPYNNMRDGMCHEGEMDIPEIIEEIMELLLSGLRDSDTVVRWSAAKGIGRITARLTSSLLEDIFLSILELFSPGEGDGSWHGGCLALAELARRGLLLPATLPKVVPVIVKALHYDIRRGPHSVGSHVRDAAAYVCWAFGRAYSQSDMKATLEQLSPHLLTVACYDREVNCRRAAAAAFQENIGRQGTFQNGINIVNAADYFSLSSRTNSYCHVAAYIAQYQEYLYPFAEELMYHKIPHWDKSVREVAAVALSTLAKYGLEYFAEHILNKLIPCMLSSDLCMRHGATLAAGELVIGLLQCGFILSTEKQKSLSDIVPAIEKARLYRGKGGEIMRSAVSRFIECISLARVLLSEKIKSSLFNTLNDNLKHPNVQIQCSAVDALKHFIPVYLAGGDSRVANDLTSKYLELLKDPNPAARRGSALVIGILPFECLAPRWRDVLSKLSASCIIEANPDVRDAEVRVNAVRSIVLVCETLTSTRSLIFDNTEEGSFLFLRIKHEVIQVLFRALDDYTIDNRGDVGSWVRDAAIDGLERCTYILCRKDSDGIPKLPSMEIPSVPELDLIARDPRCLLFDADTATNLIGGIAKQAVEKLDKLRESAVKVLHRILYSKKFPLASIPHVEAIKEIIPSETNLKWGVPKLSFPCLVKLLQFPCYSKAVLSGLVISVGGLQDSLRKVSLAVLLEYIQDSETNLVGKKLSREYMLSLDLLWILKHYQKSDRVIVPTLKTIEILLSKKIFSDMKMGIPFDERDHTRDFYVGVLDSLTIELKATKDFSKLLMGLSILGFIASSTECINSSAFTLLISFLAHRYPKIRKASADQVYLVILQNENLVAPDKREEALEVVAETCWEGDIDEAKCRRAQLSVMVGVDFEIITREPKKDNRKSASNDKNLSYSSLVGFSGF